MNKRLTSTKTRFFTIDMSLVSDKATIIKNNNYNNKLFYMKNTNHLSSILNRTDYFDNFNKFFYNNNNNTNNKYDKSLEIGPSETSNISSSSSSSSSLLFYQFSSTLMNNIDQKIDNDYHTCLSNQLEEISLVCMRHDSLLSCTYSQCCTCYSMFNSTFSTSSRGPSSEFICEKDLYFLFSTNETREFLCKNCLHSTLIDNVSFKFSFFTLLTLNTGGLITM